MFALGFASAAALPVRGASSGRAVCVRAPPVRTRMAVEAAAHTLDGRTISGPVAPVGQNLLVKVAEAEEQTQGGLFLASTAKEKPTYGVAVAVGTGKFMPSGVTVPMMVQAGDTVLYGKYGGTEVVYDGDKHCFVTQDDVLCVLAGGAMKADAVRPIYDRVLVLRDDVAEETAGGIVLGKAAEKPLTGTVIAVGPGRLMEDGNTEPVPFKKDSKVMFGKYAGTDVSFEGKDYMLLRISDVIATW